jgi:hypothetical protein
LYLAANQIGDGRPAASIWAVPSPAKGEVYLARLRLGEPTNARRLLAATEIHDENEREVASSEIGAKSFFED